MLSADPSPCHALSPYLPRSVGHFLGAVLEKLLEGIVPLKSAGVCHWASAQDPCLYLNWVISIKAQGFVLKLY